MKNQEGLPGVAITASFTSIITKHQGVINLNHARLLQSLSVTESVVSSFSLEDLCVSEETEDVMKHTS